MLALEKACQGGANTCYHLKIELHFLKMPFAEIFWLRVAAFPGLATPTF
jgi:hypothetical protein